jgi:hypothetical protein
MDNEIRTFGYCEACGNMITDDCNYIFVDSDGNYFDSIECLIEHFGVVRLEM